MLNQYSARLSAYIFLSLGNDRVFLIRSSNPTESGFEYIQLILQSKITEDEFINLAEISVCRFHFLLCRFHLEFCRFHHCRLLSKRPPIVLLTKHRLDYTTLRFGYSFRLIMMKSAIYMEMNFFSITGYCNPSKY